jgi:hypothetical protein
MKIKGTPCWGRIQYTSDPEILAHMIYSAELRVSCKEAPEFEAREYLPALSTWLSGHRKVKTDSDGMPLQVLKRYRVVSFEIEIEEIDSEA